MLPIEGNWFWFVSKQRYENVTKLWNLNYNNYFYSKVDYLKGLANV